MSACPSCKSTLQTDHAFCPNCGADLRKDKSESESKEVPNEINAQVETNSSVPITNTRSDYKTPFIISLSFSAVSIFIWSYVYTNWSFNFEVFIGKLINNSFWIVILPYLICLPFKKQRRASVYFNMVFLFIGIGIILLFLGYSQIKANQDPFMVRIQLKQPCIDNVTQQMEKYDVSYEIKNLRATKYCDCLLEKIKDDDMAMVGKGEKEFWSMITENYKEENRDCVQISLQNN
jgi:hypothetical protein